MLAGLTGCAETGCLFAVTGQELRLGNTGMVGGLTGGSLLSGLACCQTLQIL